MDWKPGGRHIVTHPSHLGGTQFLELLLLAVGISPCEHKNRDAYARVIVTRGCDAAASRVPVLPGFLLCGPDLRADDADLQRKNPRAEAPGLQGFRAALPTP